MNSITICLIGLGPWGLSVLERIISRARQQQSRQTRIRVHVIEPGDPGVGVHTRDLPDYILLNTICSQVSMFVEDHFPDIPSPQTGPNLLEWVRARGYRLKDGSYAVVRDQGREISPEDFLPRRLLGEYLSWFYQHLLTNIPSNVSYSLHENSAVNIESDDGNGEIVVLDNGERIEADYVFLTTGHTRNQPRGACVETGHQPVDYPVEKYLASIKPVNHVGVAGFGLVAMDIVAALTLGRGGRYQRNPDTGRCHYVPSGYEPRISMFSRSGLPYCPRPAISRPPSMRYTPVFFTRERIDQIRGSKIKSGGDGRIDFLADVAPVLWDEMTYAYYAWGARLAHGDAIGEAVGAALKDAWHRGDYAGQVSVLAREYGTFDPRGLLLMEWPDLLQSSTDYQSQVCALIESDLADAKEGEIRSARKAALELFRVLRDTIRYVVDFGGLLPESRSVFINRIVTRINRLIVGPPLERSEEVLALIQAGILRIPFGPAPRITRDSETGMPIVSSTRLKEQFSLPLDAIIHAYIDQPTVERSASPLMKTLFRSGRIQSFRDGDRIYSGAWVDERLHPINRHGQAEERLWVLGPLTEGVKYFNFYLPSPASRFRAFREADDCVQAILASTVAPIGSVHVC